MGEEKNFEKKSTKKIAIIVAIVVLLVALVAGGLFYLSGRNKPEKIFEDAVKDVFKMTEGSKEKVNSGRITLELSADINTAIAEFKTINPIVKAVKIYSVTEFDMDKKIFNQNLSATYDNEPIISADALLQDEKIYVYLKDLYSKYIDVTDEITSELGAEFDLSTIFETSAKTVNEDLINDVKNIIIEKINSSELEEEKVELKGEKVQKSTMTLTAKETMELFIDVLKKVNEHENNEELKTMIQDLEDSMEYNDYGDESVLEISIYSKGIKNEIVKCDVNFKEDDESLMKIEYNKENKNKATLTAVMDEQLIGAIIETEENNTQIKIVFNEEEATLDTAIEMLKIEIAEENENEGTIKLSMDIGKIMADSSLAQEKVEAIITLNIKYKVEKNAKIEERNTANAVKASNMTDEDAIEIYQNIEKNDFLYSIMNSLYSEQY